MAETNLMNSTTVVLHPNVLIEPSMNVNNTSSFKRKLDKLKSKFFELFFSANSSCSKPSTNESNKTYVERTISTNTLNSSMLISNCYYGYKSSLIETSFVEEIHSNNSSKNQMLNKNSSIEQSSSATTAVTSEFSHKTNSNTNINSLITIINTGYYSNINNAGDERNNHLVAESCNENNKENNPFLNSKYTDLIHFNTKLSLLSTYFESYLDLIDDQDNFFNIDFMINYISYILLICIKRSSCNTKNESKPVIRETKNGENVLKKIASQIYLESENEPCGLKGCQINVYLENLNEKSLITQFRIDSTCSLTTFELDLTFKCDREHTGANSNQSSSITNLTKRLFTAANSNINTLKPKQTKNQSKHNQLDYFIYLDSASFDLSKRKLY